MGPCIGLVIDLNVNGSSPNLSGAFQSGENPNDFSIRFPSFPAQSFVPSLTTITYASYEYAFAPQKQRIVQWYALNRSVQAGATREEVDNWVKLNLFNIYTRATSAFLQRRDEVDVISLGRRSDHQLLTFRLKDWDLNFPSHDVEVSNKNGSLEYRALPRSGEGKNVTLNLEEGVAPSPWRISIRVEAFNYEDWKQGTIQSRPGPRQLYEGVRAYFTAEMPGLAGTNFTCHESDRRINVGTACFDISDSLDFIVALKNKLSLIAPVEIGSIQCTVEFPGRRPVNEENKVYCRLRGHYQPIIPDFNETELILDRRDAWYFDVRLTPTFSSLPVPTLSTREQTPSVAPSPRRLPIVQASSGHRRAPTPPRDDYGRAPTPPRGDYGRAPTPPRGDYGRAPTPPRGDYRRAPTLPRGDYGRAPTPPRGDYGRARTLARTNDGGSNSVPGFTFPGLYPSVMHSHAGSRAASPSLSFRPASPSSTRSTSFTPATRFNANGASASPPTTGLRRSASQVDRLRVPIEFPLPLCTPARRPPSVLESMNIDGTPAAADLASLFFGEDWRISP